MWLLSTDRAELRFFPSPGHVNEGYAILSHVWGNNEQSFQDVQAFRKTAEETNVNPRSLVSDKIRQCCLLAERHGYKWVWNDTCCIDKTSSAELSEAINSMFLYYSRADICYAYLQDVPSDTTILENGWDNTWFRNSRWWKRGWTLQELIAPDLLVFMSADWKVLGSKMELAGLVEEITNIPMPILRKEMDLEETSIARRMSWAAARETTRVEDRAYSLLGIFGLNLPTLYGEGERAFQRLQEEIMRRSIDPSLFIWGDRLHFEGVSHAAVDAENSSTFQHNHNRLDSYLLAASPSDFENCGDISVTPPKLESPAKASSWFASQHIFNWKTRGPTVKDGDKSNPQWAQDVGIPSFSITPYGVHARVPVFQSFGYTVAVLFCSDSAQQAIGLFLSRCPDASDPKRPLYHCGGQFSSNSVRTTTLGHDVTRPMFYGKEVRIEWRDVFITHLPPSSATTPLRILMNHSILTPFRFPKLEMERINKTRLRLVSITRTAGPWNGTPPISFMFRHFRKFMVVIRFGRCTNHLSSPTSPDEPQELGPHWANVHFYTDDPPPDIPGHACPADHVREWPDLTRTFTVFAKVPDFDTRRVYRKSHITLSFIPCSINPRDTLVVQLSQLANDGFSSDFSKEVAPLVLEDRKRDLAEEHNSSDRSDGSSVQSQSTSNIPQPQPSIVAPSMIVVIAIVSLLCHLYRANTLTSHPHTV